MRKPLASLWFNGPAGIRTLINWSLLNVSRSQPHFLAAPKPAKKLAFLQYPGYATGPRSGNVALGQTSLAMCYRSLTINRFLQYIKLTV